MSRANFRYPLTTVLFVATLIVATVQFGGAGGCGGGGAHTLAAPTLNAIIAAMGGANSNGMVPSLPLAVATLPPCTKEDGSGINFAVSYSLEGLPAWISFDGSTRTFSLANGSVVPDEANTAAPVTYICTDSSNTSLSASIDFTINDLDQGGLVDGLEYRNGAVPLVNNSIGLIVLNPGNVDLYRTPEASLRKIPTGIVVTTVGMNASYAVDEGTDFDGDGATNSAEIINGTNPFVAASAGTFAAKVDYPTGNGPQGFATADFDSDGDLDLAVTNNGDNDISVLLGNGDGTFAAKVDYPTGAYPFALTAADFDGDGDLDLAVANDSSNTLSVLLGIGDGTFAAKVDYSTGNVPEGVTAADLDDDGDLDLAVPNIDDSTVSVFLGNGNGTFAAKVDFPTGAGPFTIASADFDGDGDADLATSNFDGDSLSVLLGNGDGTFAPKVDYPTGVGPGYVAAGDLDSDGDLDLVVSNAQSDTLSVFLNQP